MSSPTFIEHFAALASRYEAVLSDVWGVVHNGERATPHACEALIKFRQQGGRVILITNAPRPGSSVMEQLEFFRVPRETYDGIVSSGDVTRDVIRSRPGQTVCHVGPPRDKPIFEGLDVRFAPLESADYVICSGLENDEVETAEDYRPRLEQMLERKLFMVCGNPDVVVERGSRLVYCAGAIADLYKQMGGEVLYAGKPYRPIYDAALAKLQPAPSRERILAIGDSLRTDLAGANAAGLDFLFLTAGIHAEQFGMHVDPQALALQDAIAAADTAPVAVMRELRW
jgi:HAD superfamily hydrolase (TIGR01459 family)